MLSIIMNDSDNDINKLVICKCCKYIKYNNCK